MDSPSIEENLVDTRSRYSGSIPDWLNITWFMKSIYWLKGISINKLYLTKNLNYNCGQTLIYDRAKVIHLDELPDLNSSKPIMTIAKNSAFAKGMLECVKRLIQKNVLKKDRN